MPVRSARQPGMRKLLTRARGCRDWAHSRTLMQLSQQLAFPGIPPPCPPRSATAAAAAAVQQPASPGQTAVRSPRAGKAPMQASLRALYAPRAAQSGCECSGSARCCSSAALPQARWLQPCRPLSRGRRPPQPGHCAISVSCQTARGRGGITWAPALAVAAVAAATSSCWTGGAAGRLAGGCPNPISAGSPAAAGCKGQTCPMEAPQAAHTWKRRRARPAPAVAVLARLPDRGL